MCFYSRDIEVCKQVLTDRSATKSEQYKKYRLGHDGGDDIFTSDGLFWKHSRRAMSHAFSAEHVRRMNQVVIEKTEDLINEKLDHLAASTNGSFDLCNEMMSLTLSVLCKASFDYNITKDEQNHFLY